MHIIAMKTTKLKTLAKKPYVFFGVSVSGFSIWYVIKYSG